MSHAPAVADAEILAEVIGRSQGDYEPDVAQAILALKFSDSQNERMRHLAEEAGRGSLSPEEHQELESFRRVGNFLALLQSKARLSLKQAGRKAE